ncbi:hypothetical protein [Polymorphospora lycopeni]|uniref:Uncharacterized protein n=1 Tax=Polymorphospora lycopeni TaxID=3140240 RepID=A0ABV5CP37_9ACTN
MVFLVPNGQVIGSISYTVASLTALDYGSLNWSRSFHYRANSVAGQAAGAAVTNTSVYAEPLCVTSCTVNPGSSTIGGSALPGHPHSATGFFSTPISGVRWAAQSGFKFWFANSLWVHGVSNPLTTTPGAHRCDMALGGYHPGCVYDSVRPVLDVPATRSTTSAWPCPTACRTS